MWTPQKAVYTEKVGFNLDHDMRPNDSAERPVPT
jgi:hypothetical protein